MIESQWAKRLAEGDPLEARCGRGRVTAEVDAWVEDQVVQHEEQK